jgi:hypothetical protein
MLKKTLISCQRKNQLTTKPLLRLKKFLSDWSEELDVDELSEKVKRVSELVRFCRNKLKNTEEEVEKVLKEMDE